jgi:hypothetical protein
MKTSITVDLGIAGATGGAFMGYFRVPKAFPVLIMSAESGMGTLQATARAVAESAGVRLAEIDKLFWCSTVPRIGDPASMSNLERALERIRGGMLVVDPTYLALPAVDPGNLFAQGALLRTLDDVCRPHEITVVMVHHLKKGRSKENDPPELSELSWSGFAEWARQWILLNRRERFEPPAPHRLWMAIGGSANHGGLWGIDIDQGEQGAPRSWEVTVMPAQEVRNGTHSKGDATRSAKNVDQVAADSRTVREYLATKLPGGDTTSGIHRATKMSWDRAEAAVNELVKLRFLEATEVHKPDRRSPRQGWKIRETADGHPIADVWRPTG